MYVTLYLLGYVIDYKNETQKNQRKSTVGLLKSDRYVEKEKADALEGTLKD